MGSNFSEGDDDVFIFERRRKPFTSVQIVEIPHLKSNPRKSKVQQQQL
jgi:hypothetical protein